MDGALLDGGDAAGGADHDSRLEEGEAAADVLDEFAQHGLGDDEVGDDAVAHGADNFDAFGGAAEGVVGFVADEDHLVGFAAYGHDGWLMQDDPPPPNMYKNVYRTEVDSDLFFKHRIIFVCCK